MKRALSIILSLALVMSLFTVFFVTTASAATAISNSSPAITSDVGEKISLSGYSVVFDGDTSATSGVTWKNSSGTVITSFTPDAKGVTKLTAVSGSKTKTIYVVAKEASETEYVLYEADMSAYNSLAEMKADGWTPVGTESLYDLSGDTLVMNNLSNPYAHIQMLLPSWLGDFGDYNFSAEAKMLSVADDGRWLALSYRNKTLNGSYPYYQMCVRNNTTASSGIEFSERNSSGWKVITTATGDLTTLTSAFHTFNVSAFGQNVSYKIDGNEVLYLTSSNFSSSTVSTEKGALGIAVAGGNLSVKNVKVTVQETVPEKAPVVLDLTNNAHEENVLINPIANVQSVGNDFATVLSADNAPGSALLTVSSISDVNSALRTAMENSVLPTFYVTSTAEADKVLSAINAYGCKDANVISPSATVLNYIRTKNTKIRTGLDLRNVVNQTSLTSKEAHNIRVSVRSAPATFCIIGIDCATKELVSELQELALAVWVKVDETSGTDGFKIDVLTAITAGVNGIITSSASEVTDIINTYLEEDSMTRTPIIIGHRGNPTQAPENTISSFWAAYRNGADVFELDVEITSDGEIIIMHDNTINRTTNYTGTKTVNQMTLAEIKQYYILANDGTVSTEKVPTLKEVLEEFQDVDIRIFLEFKGSNASNVPAACKLLNEYDYGHKVDVISFSSSFVSQTQANFPGMSTGLLVVPTESDGTSMEKALASLYSTINTVQIYNSTVNPACTVLRSDGNYYAQAITDRGMTVWPWTYSGSESNNIGFLSGCDGVTTDQVEWSKDMVKLMTADDFSLVVGGEYAGGAAAIIEYDGDETLLKARDSIITVISGNEYVEIVDGKLVGKAAGTAKVIFGYNAVTSYGSDYVVYSQPVTVTVTDGDKNTFLPLIKIAETLTYDEYEEDVLEDIRTLYAEANRLSASSDATAAQIADVCIKLAECINNEDCVIEIPSVDASYTRDTPDYTYSGANPDLFKDDGIRLTDGVKSSTGITSATYAAWKAASSPVDIVVDLGKVTGTNVYNIYTCGDFWGIRSSNGFTVYGSNDGTDFTEIGSTTTVNSVGNGDMVDGSTQSKLYSLTVTADSVQNYRYIKFSVNINGNFLWIDEVEAVLDTATPASDEGIYINGVNSLITEGDTHIFTPDFNNGLITAAANHRYTRNIIAKWSDVYNGYIVTSVSTGDGTVDDIQLADDEIFIASHYSDYVEESMSNFNKATKIEVGQQIAFYGVDVENAQLGIAPYIKAVTPAEPEPDPAPAFLRGDVNDNGSINSTDYFILKRVVLGLNQVENLPTPETAEERCDVNNDGKLNGTDYLLLKRAVLGVYNIPQD